MNPDQTAPLDLGLYCLQYSLYKNTGLDKQNFSVKLLIISYPSVLTYVLGAQKNHPIEMVLLSTHNICFG